MKNQIIQNIKVIVLALLLVIGVNYVFADFSAPLNAPPTCTTGQPGCDAPINVGGSSQIKSGTLTTGGLGILGNFTFLPSSGTPPTSGQILMADDTDLAHGKVKWATLTGNTGNSVSIVTSPNTQRQNFIITNLPNTFTLTNAPSTAKMMIASIVSDSDWNTDTCKDLLINILEPNSTNNSITYGLAGINVSDANGKAMGMTASIPLNNKNFSLYFSHSSSIICKITVIPNIYFY